MAWAIITIYISKCAQMNPQQLPKTSKFYSRCQMCDIEKTLGAWVPPPLGSPKVNNDISHCFTSLSLSAFACKLVSRNFGLICGCLIFTQPGLSYGLDIRCADS